MKKQKILEIHEIRPEFLDLDLSGFDIFTFDDGLYTQYQYHEYFAGFGKQMIFFISTDIICPDLKTQNTELISCYNAHELYFKNQDKSHYMTIDQIKELSKHYTIGGHTHTHPNLKTLSKVKQIKCAIEESKIMMSKFGEMGVKITDFCYPYNDIIEGYRYTLSQMGIVNFYGPNRIPIESPLNSL